MSLPCCRLVNARRAWGYTNETIDIMEVIKPPELSQVNTGMLAGEILFSVCLVLSLLMAIWRGIISTHVDDQGVLVAMLLPNRHSVAVM